MRFVEKQYKAMQGLAASLRAAGTSVNKMAEAAGQLSQLHDELAGTLGSVSAAMEEK